jgi:hypothetical protein
MHYNIRTKLKDDMSSIPISGSSLSFNPTEERKSYDPSHASGTSHSYPQQPLVRQPRITPATRQAILNTQQVALQTLPTQGNQ